jgi:hypothetical protein
MKLANIIIYGIASAAAILVLVDLVIFICVVLAAE